jgi:hypothetical protein
MQVPSIPTPIVTNALPQDIAAKAVPHTQAVAPLVKNAIAPTPKSEKFNEIRGNRDKPKGNRGENKNRREEDDKEGNHSVNIRV